MADPAPPAGFVPVTPPPTAPTGMFASKSRKRASGPVPTPPPPPPGFEPVEPVPLTLTGQAHDGDTFRLTDGRNGRLYGADAYELGQSGRTPGGVTIPLGVNARDFAGPYLTPDSSLGFTGAQTYGRPVTSVQSDGRDLGHDLINSGNALATPEYLRGDPARLHDYMEAERLARLNYRGGFATDAQSPSDYRHGRPPAVDPWARAQPLDPKVKGGEVLFWDEPTPFQGLRPEIEKGYAAVFQNMDSTPADLLAYAKANGFQVDPAKVRTAYANRAKTRNPNGRVTYERPPRVLTDPGDGAFGATMRGVADPLNMLDEVGGLGDALLPNSIRTKGQERENIWNSDRRFGDVLWNNIEQNRQILGYDEANHPWARFGGQMAGGLIVPGASVEGVGFAAARASLRAGATRYAAEQLARRAVARRLGAVGAVEGAASGFGQGENLADRLSGAAIGAPIGAGLGIATPFAVSGAGKLVRRLAGRDANAGAVDEVAGDVGKNAAEQDLTQGGSPPPPPGYHPVDRIDLEPSRPAYAEVSRGEAASMPLTAPPVPPKSLVDVAPEVGQWASAQGATPHAGGALPEVMLHGSPQGGITEFDPYGRSGYGLFGTGTYLTDNPGIAASYTKKGLKAAGDGADQSVYAVQHSVKNPLDMDAPADPAKWEAAAARVLGDPGREAYFSHLPNGATNEQFWREVEDHLASEQVYKSDGQEAMDALVRSLGNDGITHIGGGRVGDGPRHRVVIALDPEQTQVAGRLSLRDLMNPRGPRVPDIIDASAKPGGNPLYSPGVLAMRAEQKSPTLIGPDMGAPPPPPGYRLVDRIDVDNRPRPLLADVTEAQRRAQGQDIRPTDVMPLPDSAVASMDEAAAINRGMYSELKAPKEEDALVSRSLPSHVDGNKRIAKKGPLDLVTWLRTQGGLKPEQIRDGGRNELEHYGIDNTPRAMDFASGENRFGKLVDPVNGMPYDEAAMRAHEAGFFPDHVDRPDVADFLDAVHATHTGRQRSFRPDDHAEVDQFNADRNARYRIEAARDAGAPMVADHSQPVDMADLDRNAPPVHAYEEWGDQAPNYAGNLKLDKLDSPQAIKRALTVTEQRVGGFDAATRGRVTQAETASLASELGMTPQQLLSRRKGQAFNAEEALAARQILAKSANELVNMAKRISGIDNPGDEAMAGFREAWTRHVAIQEQVAGVTAEAGRVLSQFRMDATSRVVRGDVLRSLAEGPHGAERMKQAADLILENASDPASLNTAAQRALKPRFQDMLVELYYNSILSGPATHAVNVVSNTMTALGQFPEHAVAATLGAPRAALKGGDDRVLFSEIGARAVGLLQGTKEGLAQAARTFATGRASDLVTKVEAQETNSIPGIAGAVIRTPTRLLAAEDELFKAMARRMELSGLAVRKAASDGLTGEARKARVADLIANPSDEMLERAFDYGRYLTFQRPLAHGSLSQGISAATQRRPILKLILPFVRTPVNILKFSAERSPVAPLLKEWRSDFLAGGARRDLAIAKTAVGTGIMALTMQMVGDGSVTGGGPADRNIAATMRANGWQPYSVKVGDKYYSYSRLDPYATTLGIAADFADLQSHMTQAEQDNVAGLLLASTLKNLADKTWFSGVVDVTQAVSDSERYGEAYLRNRVASVAVPALAAQAAKSLDPGQKQAQTILDAIRARVPGLSQSVPNRQDVWGRDVVNEGGLGPDIISPVRISTPRNDPANAAIVAAGAHIGAPGKKVGQRKLSGGEYRTYSAASGALAHNGVATLVTSPEWQSIPPDERADAIRGTVSAARKSVRSGMFGSSPKGSRGVPPPPPGYSFAPPAPPPGYSPAP